MYEVTHRADGHGNFYGLWALPGDKFWRKCRYQNGHEIPFCTAEKAESAAMRLVLAYLNEKAVAA